MVSRGFAAEPPNVVFILSDDHRFDFMSCIEGCPEFLKTPNMDRIASEGAVFKNAFVSTSLCSPSRASILTGQYMHHHRVVDNQRDVPVGTRFFPSDLQSGGYNTAFVGKWHMGHDSDEPRSGFDYWASFLGQGVYHDPTLNINGKQNSFSGYTTDVLTDLAIDWLRDRDSSDKPFFLYLSYKAVHYPFTPAPRNQGKYKDEPIDYPETMANTERNYRTQPNWVRNRRYSIHGIDHMETGAFDNDPVPDFDDLYHAYAETVFGLDENVGRVLDYVDQAGLRDNTIVIYMGDNGFELGEHGFYDKRDAFEHSIRVPMLARAPGRIAAGTIVEEMVQNIDVAATILDVCDVQPSKDVQFDGRSMRPLWEETAESKQALADLPWRDHLLYEYHWEWNFPATPTTLAIRTDRFKYIYYHGVWDQNGFYDLKTDPHERHNLIDVPAYQQQITSLQNQLFDELQTSGGLALPIRPPVGERLGQRKLPR
ncbi:sulfatase family protein [Rubripirellula lacrimiformis]|uniref:sulfatase family protein n=1 Tax=Rubripirellula lacrimiformis TaxID=1930273 RepID=UPI0021BCCAA1|nr:sulfatase [Rubripirellula lacrimiformis]